MMLHNLPSIGYVKCQSVSHVFATMFWHLSWERIVIVVTSSEGCLKGRAHPHRHDSLISDTWLANLCPSSGHSRPWQHSWDCLLLSYSPTHLLSWSHLPSRSLWFSCTFNCPVAALPGTGGFPSSETSTSGFPTSCPPGLSHSPHPTKPPETTGDLICTKHMICTLEIIQWNNSLCGNH